MLSQFEVEEPDWPVHGVAVKGLIITDECKVLNICVLLVNRQVHLHLNTVAGDSGVTFLF